MDHKEAVTMFLKHRIAEAEQRQEAVKRKFIEKAAPLFVGPQSSTLIWIADDAHPEIFKFSVLDKFEQVIIRSIFDEATNAYNASFKARMILDLWLEETT